MPKEYLYRVTDRRPGAALPVRFVIGHRQEQALNFVSRSTFDVELCDGLAGAQAVIDGYAIERAVQAETAPTALLPLEGDAVDPSKVLGGTDADPYLQQIVSRLDAAAAGTAPSVVATFTTPSGGSEVVEIYPPGELPLDDSESVVGAILAQNAALIDASSVSVSGEFSGRLDDDIEAGRS